MVSFTRVIVGDPQKLKEQLNVITREHGIIFTNETMKDEKLLTEHLNAVMVKTSKNVRFTRSIVRDPNNMLNQLNVAFQ